VWLTGVIGVAVIGVTFGFVYGITAIVAVGLLGPIVAQMSKRRVRW
jgi:hypothetical protein